MPPLYALWPIHELWHEPHIHEPHNLRGGGTTGPHGWAAECFDHIANLRSGSRTWTSLGDGIMEVLGFEDFMLDEPTFLGSELTFLRSGGAALALLKICDGTTALSGTRAQKGHFALRVSGAIFWRLHRELPHLLEQHRVTSSHRTDSKDVTQTHAHRGPHSSQCAS